MPVISGGTAEKLSDLRVGPGSYLFTATTYPRPSNERLMAMAGELQRQGVIVRYVDVLEGAPGEVRMAFEVPQQTGVGILPAVVLAIGLAIATAIGGTVFGWRLSETLPQSFSKALIPAMLIAGATFVLYTLVNRSSFARNGGRRTLA